MLCTQWVFSRNLQDVRRMNISKIEKVFSWIGDLWKIFGVIVLLLIMGHYSIGALMFVKAKILDVSDDYYTSVSGKYELSEDEWKTLKKLATPNFRSEPYYHFRSREIHTQYFNIDSEGIRYTKKEPTPKADSKKVWLFGGSTMWGHQVSDWHTIPSYLQSRLGQNYDVYNFGETSYVSTQELNFLLYQIALENIPDIVIFYDGVNDGYGGTYSPAIPRHLQTLGRMSSTNLIIDLYSRSHYFSLTRYLNEKHQTLLWNEKIESKVNENVKKVVPFYEAHIKQAKALSKEYGFKVFFFWQPNSSSLTKKYLHSYETKVIDNTSEMLMKSQQQVYLHAKQKFSNREAENIYFLGDIFNESNELIYMDWCHLSPMGNDTIANEIYKHIR